MLFILLIMLEWYGPLAEALDALFTTLGVPPVGQAGARAELIPAAGPVTRAAPRASPMAAEGVRHMACCPQWKAGADVPASQAGAEDMGAAAACGMCQSTDPECLGQCGDCRRWFCNGTWNPAQPSHLVWHLAQKKHRSLRLHRGHPLGRQPIECTVCQAPDIWRLSVSTSLGRGPVVCCEPCIGEYQAADWPMSWSAVVGPRAIAGELLPSREAKVWPRCCMRAARRAALAEAGARAPEPGPATEDRPSHPQVPDVFLSAKHYHRVFLPLVKLELENASKETSSSLDQGVVAKLDRHQDSYVFLEAGSSLRVKVGCFLTIGHPACGDVGLFVKVLGVSGDAPKRVRVLLRHVLPEHEPLLARAMGFTVKAVENPLPYLRVLEALERFAQGDGLDPALTGHVLGRLLPSAHGR
ncbi:hypothetical protein H696_05436 [Fonticula alba]|uniref:Upf1 domain-containing protein n=1 Tax=Fonticula alba TaxID=691883 RepID=A0A058Z254_FONAL|nr:hypothetical protein H696_05436 [Fonticula alba]KCV67978.1 hypothetical protein H696_05436 [Fonticula alba]|eukprot:XP_009497545.1 hypothetical protein H696_05436 [Fonticula alba]